MSKLQCPTEYQQFKDGAKVKHKVWRGVFTVEGEPFRGDFGWSVHLSEKGMAQSCKDLMLIKEAKPTDADRIAAAVAVLGQVAPNAHFMLKNWSAQGDHDLAQAALKALAILEGREVLKDA